MAQFAGKHKLTALALVLLLPLLQGCAAAVIGATAGGTAVALDSRDVGTQADDEALRFRIQTRFRESGEFEDYRVRALPYNSDVLLYGQVRDEAMKAKAESIAKETDGVYQVFNQLRIDEPARLTTSTNDTWLTTRVKTQLLRDRDHDLSGIKVMTEKGEVFLFGIVAEEAASTAIEIARHVSGVKQVVDVLTRKPAS